MKNLKTLRVNGTDVPVKENKLFSLNWNDFFKGLLIAVLTPILDFILIAVELYSNGAELVIDWHRALGIGVAAFIVYLSKNFLSPTTVVIDKKDLQ